MPHDQSLFAVRFGWGLQGVEALAAADVVVIVDVLSFSTTVDVAVAAGAEVLPYRFEDDSAVESAADQGAVLAVHRNSAGPDSPYSLSPASLLGVPPGTRVVLPSPNGATLSLAAATSGATVIAGCLRNRGAVAAAAGRYASVAVIAAGERWPDESLRPAVEDLLGAGAIIDALGLTRSPEAVVAAAAFRASGKIDDLLLGCASGRELDEQGWTEDVLIAAQTDASMQVPLLVDGVYRASQ